MYALMALLSGAALYATAAIIGGLLYLNDASRHSIDEMWSESLPILRTESALVFVVTLFLFWIGSVRTYLKRTREAGHRGQTEPICSQTSKQI